MAVVMALAIFSLLGLTSASASAQTPPAQNPACAPPGTGSDYPPTQPAIEPSLQLSLSTGLLLPGTTTGNLLVTGAVPNLTYCGILFSAPVVIDPTVAAANGDLHFDNLAIPSDFKLNAMHHLDVYRRGSLVGAFDFCVTTTGHLATASACQDAAAANNGSKSPGASHGALPRTGWDHLVEVLKAAGLALAAGALFMYLRRRRRASLEVPA
jgi:LPXTG-motif cell wall-anchored protein